MRRASILILAALGMVLGTQSAMATTFAVGRCRPLLKSFTTIQAAVLASAVGGIVEVCPGTYREQVTIGEPLTLEGVSFGTAGRAVIAVPTTGMVVNATSLFGGLPVAAQVLVIVGSGTINISNLTVDGSGNGLSIPDVVAGIFYDVGTSGTVNKVTTRNQMGDGLGVGISAQNSIPINGNVTIENCSIHDADFAGIFLLSNQTPPTLIATVKGNRVSGSSLSSGITDQAGGTVTGNVISGSSFGIDLQSGSTASVTGNTVTDSQDGIAIQAGTNVVKSNIIWNSSGRGIDLFGSGATIESNNITKAAQGIEFGCFTATVSGNTISDASVGIDFVPTSVVSVNTYVNVDITRTGGC